ncbi:MAG TPA: DUF2953 domain-containing protein [Methanobacteriaceae archaeon]|nr:DUF2953 domain-containing protein [Methanobacteriaceae archaeon]
MLIILSLLLIPFHISLWLSKTGKSIHGTFKLRWLGLTIFKRQIPSPKPSSDKKEKDEKKKQEWTLDRIKKTLNLLYGALPHLKRILWALFYSTKIEKLSFNLNLGLESPADTAIVTGYIWAFTESTRYFIPMEIFVTPDFQNQVMDGSFNLKLKLKLLKITTELIRAITKKPVRSLFNELRG